MLTDDIFSSNFIDISYIGEYNLKISTVGLSNNDFEKYYLELSNNFTKSNELYDISRNYNILVKDTRDPSLSFINQIIHIDLAKIFHIN